ncbi:hypothetical protein Hanom_Chr15g01365921 [Helianthus anomalus]
MTILQLKWNCHNFGHCFRPKDHNNFSRKLVAKFCNPYFFWFHKYSMVVVEKTRSFVKTQKYYFRYVQC